MTNDEVLVLQADDDTRRFKDDSDTEQKISVENHPTSKDNVENISPPPSKRSSAIEIDMIDDFSEICGLGGIEGFQTAMTVRRITNAHT